jgi:HEAT repeat protein
MARKSGLFDSLFKKIGLKPYDYENLDECLRALEDKDPETRIKALEAMAQKSDLQDVSPIVRVMTEDVNFRVQEAAMNAIGDLNRREGINPLIEMLGAQDQWLKVKAAMILGQMGVTDALESIKEASAAVRGEYQSAIERVITKMEAQRELEKAQQVVPLQAAPQSPQPPPARQPQPETPLSRLKAAAASLDSPTAKLASQSRGQDLDMQTAKLQPQERPSIYPPPVREGPAYETKWLEGRKQEMRAAPDERTPQVAPPPVHREERETSPERIAVGDDKLEENLRFQLARASSAAADDRIVHYYYRALTKGEHEAEMALCSYLKGETETYRLQALQALTGLERKPHIIDALLESLGTCSPKMCWRLIVALCSVEDVRIAAKLLAMLNDTDVKIRKHSHNYFLVHNTPEMVDALMKDYSSCDEAARIERASLIARMDIDEVRPALSTILQNPQEYEKVVLSILDKLPPRQESVISASLPVLLRRKEETVMEIIPRFLRDSRNLLLIEYLRQNLFSATEIIKGRSAALLGHMQDRATVHSIARLLQDQSEYVRLQAGRAILALNAREHHKMLYAIVKKDPSLKNRLEFIKIIDQLYQDQALVPFLDLLTEPVTEIKCLVLDNLAKRAWPDEEKARIIGAAHPLLEDEDSRVVFYALVLLVKMGAKSCISDRKKLLTLLWTVIKEERNPSKIRREALYSMLTISRNDTREVLKSIVKNDSDEEMRMQSAYYLSSYDGKDVEDALMAASRSTNRNIAGAARESLKKLQKRAK